MSDILQDQKIHYIVKDYRRMFDNYSKMVDGIKEATEALRKKDMEIAKLKAKLAKTSTDIQLKALKERTHLIADQVKSVVLHAGKAAEQVAEMMQIISGGLIEPEVELKTNETEDE